MPIHAGSFESLTVCLLGCSKGIQIRSIADEHSISTEHLGFEAASLRETKRKIPN